jgi:hypothetical protein
MKTIPMETAEKQNALWQIHSFYEGMYSSAPEAIHAAIHENKRFAELKFTEADYDFCEHMIIWNSRRKKAFSKESVVNSKVWFNEYTTL